MTEEKIVVTINMMGGFTCETGSGSMEFIGATSSKMNQLFTYLAYNFPNTVPLRNVKEALYGDSDVDMDNSFKALLFRLRKSLAEELKVNVKECVVLKGGMIGLTDKFEIHSDVGGFKEFYTRALLSMEDDEKLDYLEKAFNIYHGELLPMLSTEPWVIFENALLRDQYSRVVDKLCSIYLSKEYHDKVYSTYKRALVYFPFEEDWIIGSIDALTAQKKFKQATVEYEEQTGMIFDEMGIYPSEKLLDVMRRICDEVSNEVVTAEGIKNVLEEDEIYGPYYCNFPSFVNTYHALERIMKRDCFNSSILLITVTDKNGKALTDVSDINPAVSFLHLAISKTLRKNDMYTRYSKSQMLILLWKSTPENAPAAIERLKKCIETESNGENSCFIDCEILDSNKTRTEYRGVQDAFGSNSWKNRHVKK